MNKPLNLLNPFPVSATVKERQAIANTLASLFKLSDENILPTSDRANEPVDINGLVVEIIEGSELEQSQRSYKTLLRQLTRQPAFARLSGPNGPGTDEFVLINDSGKLLQAELTQSSATHFESEDVTNAVTRAIPSAMADIELLAKAAKLTGGIVSSNEYIPLMNWLQFHQLQSPKTVYELSNLINLMNLKLPKPPTYGNYWGLSDDSSEASLAITPDQHSLIQMQIARVVNKDSDRPEPLLNYLADAMPSSNRSPAFLQDNPEQSWELIVDTAQAKAFTQACFDAMNPDASSTGKVLTLHQRSTLLVAAIMMDFGLADEHQQRFYHAFHLYDPRYVQANRYEIEKKFTDIVVNSFFVHETAAPLALQLIFAGLAPEFLVVAPAALQLGSSGWVMLRKSVMLAESIAPGLSRRMSYEALKELGAIAPASPAQQTLHDLIMTRCILDWTTINGFGLDGEENLPTQRVVEHAMTRYNAFLEEISDAFTNITTQPVSRRAQARSAILETGLDPELEIAKAFSGEKDSLIDLHLARRLSAFNFDDDMLNRLIRLEPANTLYAREIDRQYALHKKGVATFVRLALSQMTVEDRVAIEQGHLALYRVIKTRPPGMSSPRRSADDLPSPYGVVMLARLNDEICAYELFPLLGACRKNDALTRLLNERSMWREDDAEFKTETYLHEIPIDYQLYFKGKALDNGSQPLSYNILLERFARFERAVEISYSRSPMESFNSGRFHQIAEQLAEHNPPLPYDAYYAMGYDKTGIEESNEKFEQIFDTILNIIIPFKECIEGLASGKADRRDSALFSCVMDTTLLLFAFVGTAGSFAKAVAGSARLLNLGKVGGRFVLSLFNPLDGVSQLVHGGARLVGKGALKLGHYGLSVTLLGAGQLRRLTTGTSGSYDLIKALSKSGSAAEIRMSLPTVAHARTLFKDDTLETVEQVVARLSEKNISVLKDSSIVELEHLFNSAVREAALPSRSLQELESLIGPIAVNDLLNTFIKNRPGRFMGTHFFTGAQDYTESLRIVAEIETRKIAYLKNHQQSVLTWDLGKPPYSDVMPESAFNPNGFTDNSQRAGAWMLKGSTSEGNDFENIVAVLREYAGNNKSLKDATVIKEIHSRLVPELAGSVREAGAPTKYGSSITGFALMEQHLKTLNSAHKHFDKHLLATIAGFQGFGDGNGRTASALYAISQLRGGRFTPMPKHVFLSLSDLG
ncbi:hypothetical protein [Pseudomonas farris]